MPLSSSQSFADEKRAAAKIKTLRLHHFRNYQEISLSVEGDIVVFIGPNGAGKTNILEAISLFAPGKGLRKAAFEDMDFCEDSKTAPHHHWVVQAEIHHPDYGKSQIGTAHQKDKGRSKRIIQADGKVLPSQARLAEILQLAWLTPEMDRLFVDSKANRRAFFDRLVFGFVPAHLTALRLYEKLMRERNKALEQPSFDPLWLDALEARMAAAATQIYQNRGQILALLSEKGAEIAPPFATLSLELLSEEDQNFEAQIVADPAAGQEALLARFRANRRLDQKAGRMLCGPHRSDILVTHLEKGQVAAQCSTGEQKALLISIMLAYLDLRAASGAGQAILLFDEVPAHLDEKRRVALLEKLKNYDAQLWLTGTDHATFQCLAKDAEFFMVEQGKLTKMA